RRGRRSAARTSSALCGGSTRRPGGRSPALRPKRRSQGGVMPDTVLGVAQEELANAGDEQKRARADLDAARAQLAQAEQDIANRTKELAKALDDIATLRQKIAAATNAAEGQALFEQLDAKRTVMRAKQAALDDAEDRADGARGRITALQIELEAAGEAEGAAA